MTADALKILDDALRLTDEDRADLAARLLESLDGETDAGATSAWDAEIRRRLDDLDRGNVKPVPWAEARRTIVKESDDAARP